MRSKAWFRFVPCLALASLLTFANSLFCGPFWRMDQGKILLDNGVVRRSLDLGKNSDRVSTVSYGLAGVEAEFVKDGSPEFRFTVGKRKLDGTGGWKYVTAEDAADSLGGKGVTVKMDAAAEPLSLEMTYLLYPGQPVVRKMIALINRGENRIKIESLDVEALKSAWEDTHCWIMTDFARHKWLGPFVGNWNDPLVVVHQIGQMQGLALGNEAPSITKRTGAFEDGSTLCIGLTHAEQDYPFLKWLKKGERWESPWVFSLPYSGEADPSAVVNGPVADFVRRSMGIRLAALREKPMFVYNTWNPFRKEVNATLVNELAEAAAACGAEEFIIDDGWQENKGDWDIDLKKFPGGLKPVFDRIKSLGMKPGLWISLTEAETRSQVYREHPEWFMRDREGHITNVHSDSQTEATACLGTGWFDHIRDVILGLAREHGLAYVKLDLSLVVSSYVYDLERTGCYAHDHPHHDGREESFLVAYRRCMQLFDQLHAGAPGLFIDCTFETWGPLQQVDYALVRHAEGDWICNVYETSPLGSLRVRNLGWWRSPVIPATALVIGNLTLDDPAREANLLSLAGTLPIMLGDPRKVPENERARLKRWAGWLREMQIKYDYMMYRQDLPGFGEPREGQWDGWARINNDSHEGGIIGVFRQGGPDSERRVTVPGLDGKSIYAVRRGCERIEVARLKGAELAEKGFTVSLPAKYDAMLFEVSRIE